MITFAQFMAKYNGKYLEVAGSSNALNQCVDLANGYIRDVLNQKIIEWTNAVDFPTKADPAIYEYIQNTPYGVPQYGDIIVWKPSPGHIAVFIEGNVDKFKSFDENFPIGSPCHVQDHTYLNVIGWLRFKGPLEDWETKYYPVKAELNERDAEKRFWEDITRSVAAVLGVPAEKSILVAEAQKLVKLEDALVAKDKELIVKDEKVTELQSQLIVMQKENDDLAKENKDQFFKIEEQGFELKRLQNEFEEYKKQKPMEQHTIGDHLLAIVNKLIGRG